MGKKYKDAVSRLESFDWLKERLVEPDDEKYCSEDVNFAFSMGYVCAAKIVEGDYPEDAFEEAKHSFEKCKLAYKAFGFLFYGDGYADR